MWSFAKATVWSKYSRRLKFTEFLSLLYSTLGDGDRFHTGDRAGQRKGLFRDFDPAMYNSKLPIADHFLNMLRRRLESRVRYALESTLPTAEEDDLLHTPRQLPQADKDRRLLLRIAVTSLPERERDIVDGLYWQGLSFRDVGRRMGVDQKQVRRWHANALQKLADWPGWAA